MSVPYIGSKISLISKSEIRYEGILYTIDPKESTVALQNVRSFGTEGRRKDGDQIPPSNEIYDYIIFRGSDIKDLHVCEPPQVQQISRTVPNDPAIISMPVSGAPPQGQGQMPSVYSQNFGFPPVNYQQFNPNFNPYGYMGNSYFGAFQPAIPQQQLQGRGQPQPGLDTKGTGQQQQAPPQQQSQGTQPPKAAPVTSSSSTQPASATPTPTATVAPASSKPQPIAPQTGVPIVQGSTPMPSAAQVQPQVQQPPSQTPARAQEQPQGPVQSAQQITGQQSTASQQQAETPEDGQSNVNQRGQRPPRRGMNNYSNRGAPSGGRGGRRGGSGSGGGRGGYGNTGTKVLEEFDFAVSNARFDKEKILEEVASKDSEGKQPAYDKTSSFFDNISCEATERKEERGNRSSLADQRKIDAETFGYSGHNRNYSGRGGRGGRRPPYAGQQGQQQQGQPQQQQQQQGQQPQFHSGNGYYNRNSQQQKVFRPVNQNNNNANAGGRAPRWGNQNRPMGGNVPSNSTNTPISTEQ